MYIRKSTKCKKLTIFYFFRKWWCAGKMVLFTSQRYKRRRNYWRYLVLYLMIFLCVAY